MAEIPTKRHLVKAESILPTADVLLDNISLSGNFSTDVCKETGGRHIFSEFVNKFILWGYIVACLSLEYAQSGVFRGIVRHKRDDPSEPTSH